MENTNYYRLKQNQIDTLFQTVSAITPEILAEVQALELKYNLNLISSVGGMLRAGLYTYAKKNILFDASYQAEQYRRLIQALAEYKPPAMDNDKTVERQERLELQTRINQFLEEFIFNNYSDMLTWLRDKHGILERTFSTFHKQYYSFIGYQKNTSLDRLKYDHLVRLSAKKRKAYLENFQMKRVRPRVQQLYDCLITLRELKDNYRFDYNLIVALIENYIDPRDRALSIQKLDNLFLEMDYERQAKQQK